MGQEIFCQPKIFQYETFKKYQQKYTCINNIRLNIKIFKLNMIYFLPYGQISTAFISPSLFCDVTLILGHCVNNNLRVLFSFDKFLRTLEIKSEKVM